MDGRDASRRRAIETNNRCWTLLEKPDRTPSETTMMVETALESLRLWREAGTPVHAQRGHWMVARVAVDAGLAELAVEHARATLDLTSAHSGELEDFDLAFAEEVAARAYALAGETGRARTHHAEATRRGQAIAGDGDRGEFFRQFNLAPWFGLATASHEPPDTGGD